MRYSYRIVRVDEKLKTMVIEYTHPSHGAIKVGARLPLSGESLEELVKRYSPKSHWESLEKEFYAPKEGTSGEVKDELKPNEVEI